MNLDDMAKAQAFDDLCDELGVPTHHEEDVAMTAGARLAYLKATIGAIAMQECDCAEKIDREKTAKSHAVMQARIWSGEARTQSAIVKDILAILGITGVPDYRAEEAVRERLLIIGNKVLRDLGTTIGMDDWVPETSGDYWSVENVRKHVTWLEERAREEGERAHLSDEQITALLLKLEAKVDALTVGQVLDYIKEHRGKTACVWCGLIPPAEDREHWKTCEEHPAREEAERLRASVATLTEQLGEAERKRLRMQDENRLLRADVAAAARPARDDGSMTSTQAYIAAMHPEFAAPVGAPIAARPARDADMRGWEQLFDSDGAEEWRSPDGALAYLIQHNGVDYLTVVTAPDEGSVIDDVDVPVEVLRALFSGAPDIAAPVGDPVEARPARTASWTPESFASALSHIVWQHRGSADIAAAVSSFVRDQGYAPVGAPVGPVDARDVLERLKEELCDEDDGCCSTCAQVAGSSEDCGYCAVWRIINGAPLSRGPEGPPWTRIRDSLVKRLADEADECAVDEDAHAGLHRAVDLLRTTGMVKLAISDAARLPDGMPGEPACPHGEQQENCYECTADEVLADPVARAAYEKNEPGAPLSRGVPSSPFQGMPTTREGEDKLLAEFDALLERSGSALSRGVPEPSLAASLHCPDCDVPMRRVDAHRCDRCGMNASEGSALSRGVPEAAPQAEAPEPSATEKWARDIDEAQRRWDESERTMLPVAAAPQAEAPEPDDDDLCECCGGDGDHLDTCSTRGDLRAFSAPQGEPPKEPPDGTAPERACIVVTVPPGVNAEDLQGAVISGIAASNMRTADYEAAAESVRIESATRPPDGTAPERADNRANAVKRWSAAMLEKLDENKHKGDHWGDDDPRDLFVRVEQEMRELAEALAGNDGAKVIREAADVANMVMMVSDSAAPNGVMTQSFPMGTTRPPDSMPGEPPKEPEP